MMTDTLRLECDNLIIGAGIAGLVAALRMRGTTIIAASGLGATAMSGGVFALPEQRDHEAEGWFIEIMRDTCCPYREGRCLTDRMETRDGLVQEITAYEGRPSKVAPGGWPESDAMPPGAEAFAGRSCQEIAHMVEADDTALEALGAVLADCGAESYVLPPVLGVSRAMQARARLEQATGARVYEYVTAPSVHGLRLLRGLHSAIGHHPSISLLETTEITSIGDTAAGIMGTKRRRPVRIGARNVVIATGGLLTGFRVDGDRVYEPLTGMTIADVDADLCSLFSADHPMMFRGIGSGLPAAGSFSNVRAAGAAAAGFGLYTALRTGYHAGDGL